jgi:hypothetical protein
VLLYGYDTELQSGTWNKSINDLAKMFLEEMRGLRGGKVSIWRISVRVGVYTYKSQHRPIIFLGHSLGGLVIKEVFDLVLVTHCSQYFHLLRVVYGWLTETYANCCTQLGSRHCR